MNMSVAPGTQARVRLRELLHRTCLRLGPSHLGARRTAGYPARAAACGAPHLSGGPGVTTNDDHEVEYRSRTEPYTD